MLLSRNRLLLAAFAAVLSMLPREGWADDAVAGQYAVIGLRPDGGQYHGVAELATRGGTYDIIWSIGSQTFRGRGVATRNALAFSFLGDGFVDANVVLYEPAAPGIWCGIWTFNDSTNVGQETLVRQSENGQTEKFDCSQVVASRDGVDAFDRKMARNDGDGHPQLADELRRQSGD